MVDVIRQIVVPNGLAQQGGYSVPPYTSVHAHDTGNPNSSMANERDYLANHYNDAFYTHLVGFNPATGRAEAWQVAEKNQGAWDLGSYNGNANGYASVEFVGGSIKNQDQFNQAYKVYVELLRQLADEAGAKKILDPQSAIATAGAGYIVTHNFASRNGFGSSHIDPLNFLASWGVSYDQFKNDIANGVGDAQPSAPAQPAPAPVAPQPQATGAIQAFKNAGNNFTAYNGFRADEIKQVNGIWQAINYDLAGGRDFSWTNNGVPLDILDNVTRGNQAATQVGDTLKFNGNYNHGTIDDYDNASNAVGIKFGNYGEIWFNADAFLKL